MRTPYLEERGWTKGLRKKYLADIEKLESEHRHGYGMCPYYDYDDAAVREREQIPTIKAALERVLSQRENRRAGSQTAVKTKQQNLLALIKSVKITVRRVSQNAVKHVSEQTFAGNYQGECDYPGWGTRTAVNCLRHDFTEYDATLDLLVGQVGKDAAYEALKNKVMDEIANVYPFLARECDQQSVGNNTRRDSTWPDAKYLSQWPARGGRPGQSGRQRKQQ